MLAGGGYAEKVAVPAVQVLPVPDGVDLVTAGGLPEVACTVWSNVVAAGRLAAGETFLIQGGSSGIGTHAIQVAKALGARVVATASPQRAERCRELGADIVIDYHDDVLAELKKATDGHGADVILDNMGAKGLAANVAALAADGRLLVIGMQGGTKAELDLNTLLRKRASVTAMSLRGRPAAGPHGKGAVVAGVRAQVWPMIADGRVRPVVHATVPMDRAGDAHRQLEAGGVVGKIVPVDAHEVNRRAGGQNGRMTQPGNGNGGSDDGDGEQHVMVVGPDGRPLGMARVPQQSEDERRAGPAGCRRHGRAAREGHADRHDDQAAARGGPRPPRSTTPRRVRLRSILSSSVRELEEGLAPELRDELNRLSTPFADDTTPSDAELRIAPGAAGGLAGGPVPGHPDGPVRPADGGAGPVGADASRAPGRCSRTGTGGSGGSRPRDRPVPVVRCRGRAPGCGSGLSDAVGTLGPWLNP